MLNVVYRSCIQNFGPIEQPQSITNYNGWEGKEEENSSRNQIFRFSNSHKNRTKTNFDMQSTVFCSQWSVYLHKTIFEVNLWCFLRPPK